MVEGDGEAGEKEEARGYPDRFLKLGMRSWTTARRMLVHREEEGPPAMSVPREILRRERLGWRLRGFGKTSEVVGFRDLGGL